MQNERNPNHVANPPESLQIDQGFALGENVNVADGNSQGVDARLLDKDPRSVRVSDATPRIGCARGVRQTADRRFHRCAGPVRHFDNLLHQATVLVRSEPVIFHHDSVESHLDAT